MVWINSNNDFDYWYVLFASSNKSIYITILLSVPFGEIKQSRIGRELGEVDLIAYINVKFVHINLA